MKKKEKIGKLKKKVILKKKYLKKKGKKKSQPKKKEKNTVDYYCNPQCFVCEETVIVIHSVLCVRKQ